MFSFQTRSSTQEIENRLAMTAVVQVMLRRPHLLEQRLLDLLAQQKAFATLGLAALEIQPAAHAGKEAQAVLAMLDPKGASEGFVRSLQRIQKPSGTDSRRFRSIFRPATYDK